MTSTCKRLSTIIITVSLVFGAAMAADSAGAVSASRAEEIALAQSGGGQVMEMRRLIFAGRNSYQFEIINGSERYIIAVDAETGGLNQLVRKHNKHLPFTATPVMPNPTNDTGTISSPVSSTAEQTLQQAMAMTGGGTLVERKIKGLHGRVIHEYEIVNNGVRYEVEIDGVTGQVVEFKQKNDHKYLTTRSLTRLDARGAEEIALRQSGGGVITEYELDHDDGRLIHEFTIVNNNRRYEIEIDDASGEILELSVK